MMNFGALFGANFWQQRSMPSEAIEKLIKNPDATIEDFLNEEEFLQESK